MKMCKVQFWHSTLVDKNLYATKSPWHEAHVLVKISFFSCIWISVWCNYLFIFKFKFIGIHYWRFPYENVLWSVSMESQVVHKDDNLSASNSSHSVIFCICSTPQSNVTKHCWYVIMMLIALSFPLWNWHTQSSWPWWPYSLFNYNVYVVSNIGSDLVGGAPSLRGSGLVLCNSDYPDLSQIDESVEAIFTCISTNSYRPAAWHTCTCISSKPVAMYRARWHMLCAINSSFMYIPTIVKPSTVLLFSMQLAILHVDPNEQTLQSVYVLNTKK